MSLPVRLSMTLWWTLLLQCTWSPHFLEIGIGFIDVHLHAERFAGPQFPAQVFLGHRHPELEGGVRGVVHPVVQVVLHNGGARTERDLPVEVREQVNAAVVVVFDNLQRVVQHHPMPQVRELAQAPANP